MRYHLTIITALLCAHVLIAQEQRIAFQDFEGQGASWGPLSYSTPPCSSEGDHWNVLTELSPLLPFEGSHFWAVQDLNGECGSSGFEWIEFPGIDLSGFREVKCKFQLQAIGYDPGDDIYYEAWHDGQPQPIVILVDGQDNYSTEGWVPVEFEVPNEVSSFSFRIYFKQNGSDQAGIDQVELFAQPVIPCTELMISEYVEGDSGTGFRNNYIELFNPGDQVLSLDGYTLVKYTADNTEPSSTLELSGSIPGHGTFLIEDNTELFGVEADLSSNSSVMDFNGDDKVALQRGTKVIDVIGVIGTSEDFGKNLVLRRKSQVKAPNTEFNSKEWDIYGLEFIKDLNRHQSYCQGPQPEILVSGNLTEIPDGITKTNRINHTYFGQLETGSGESVSNDLIILNTGTAPLQVDSLHLQGSLDDFMITNVPGQSLDPGDSLQITVRFQPVDNGLRSTQLTLYSNDPSEAEHSILLQGEGTHESGSPLMITKYYEGASNNRWIEVTNVGDRVIDAGEYFLALFRQDLLDDPIGSKPSSKKAIPSTIPGQTLTFRASLNVTEPSYALDGSEIATGVCGFNGDDVIVISRSDDESCWVDRSDIVGKQGNWGTDIAYVRKYGCQQSSPHTGYLSDQWQPYSPEEINAAPAGSNSRLGLYRIGNTDFVDGAWSNGPPDLNRSVRVLNDYDTSQMGSIECCNLNVTEAAHLLISAQTYVAIHNDLLVSGRLTVAHDADLLMIDNDGQIDNEGVIEVQKISAPLHPFDYTYWSSPMDSLQFREVFTPFDQRQAYSFVTSSFIDQDGDGSDDDQDAWKRESEDMIPGVGYAVLTPGVHIPGRKEEVFFKGEPNNGIIQVPLELQEPIDGVGDWNLIGNPYPSAIDAEALINHHGNTSLIGGTLYFWTHHTPIQTDALTQDSYYEPGDYAMYTIGTGGIRAQSGGVTPSRFVSSCQGFFVEAIDRGLLTFENSMRIHDPSPVFFKNQTTKERKSSFRTVVEQREPESSKIWLNLRSDNGAFSQVLIGFVEGATKGYDRTYDGQRLVSETGLNFYSPVDGFELAIRGEPELTGEEHIPLSFRYGLNRDDQRPGLAKSPFSIELDSVSGRLNDFKVIITDTYLGIRHDLSRSPYDFSEVAKVDRGAHRKNRFVLSFEEDPDKEATITEEVTADSNRVLWHFENEKLVVRTLNNDRIHTLKMNDLLGRRVLNWEKEDETLIRIPFDRFARRAPYFIQLVLDNSEVLRSKVLPMEP